MRILACMLVFAIALTTTNGRPKTKGESSSGSRSEEANSDERDSVTRLQFSGKKSTCGYDSCPVVKDGIINVHLVAHTHDDVGWLKTVDQYYYGSNTRTQSAGVQYILDSVIDALIKDPNRKFVYVETAFFWRWWGEQGDLRRHQVQRLVAEGRLEFAGGAWSMNDEAVTHYQSIVDQFSWGLRKLNDTFGECGRPRTGWQIDPFGHSREMANLFAGMGYDSLLLGRSDYQDKTRRLNAKEMEMVWRGSDDLGQSSDLFTGIMYNTYSPPPGFCFDVLCADDPIIDDVNSPDYNVDVMVKKFVDYVKAAQGVYRSNNIIITMGGDFTYMQAEMYFYNMDKLIKYANEREPSVRLFYSTPSCYIKSVHDSKVKFPTKQDDFFPYASDPNSYWTGYFTSRPTLKYFERKANSFLQVCKQLYAMTNLNEKDKIDLNMLRTAMGIMQHHDAVTGTEKQHVARDYARILEQGVQDCLITTREALNDLMSEPPSRSRDREDRQAVPYMPVTLCELNITQCSVSEESQNFIVTLYNPLGHVLNHYARIPVSGNNFTVQDPEGKSLSTQFLILSNGVYDQLTDRNSSAVFELVFLAEIIPPLGYKSFYISTKSNSIKNFFKNKLEKKDGGNVDEIMMSDKPLVIEKNDGMPLQRLSGADPEELTNKIKKALEDENSIGNEHLTISVDAGTGFISQLFVARYNLTIPLKQDLQYYEGEIGNNEIPRNRSSGAYIFRPKSSDAKPISSKPVNKVYKGHLVEELHQTFSNWATQVVRIYKNVEHVEFEWIVGPIPVDDKIGKEVISRFSTNLNTNGVFFTDSNGRQLLKRVRNQRPTWNLTLEEPVAGNYYPVTSAIAIHDAATQLDISVLTDRAQGGASLRDGEIELMVHRRLLHDDAFGVGEALDEKDGGRGLVAKGTHYLYVGKQQDKGSVVRRQLMLKKQLEPSVFLTSADNITFSQWQLIKNEFSGLSQELPANVHLLTVEPWKDNTVLVRLEHFLQKTDDPADLSLPAVVNLKRVFSGIQIISVRETTLGANQYIEDSNRFQWESEEFKDEPEVTDNSVYRNAERNIQSREENEVKEDVLSKIDEIHDLVERNRRLISQMQKKMKHLTHNQTHSPKPVKDRSYYDYYPTAESNYMKDKKSAKKVDPEDGYLEITLNPMQIRTFIITAKFLD